MTWDDLGQLDESDALGKCTTLGGWDKDTKSWREGRDVHYHGMGKMQNSRGNRTAACMKTLVLWHGEFGNGGVFFFFSWL